MDAIKQFICDEVKHLSHDEKTEVLKIIERSCRDKIKPLSNGNKINLDHIPIDVIQQIYKYIKIKYDDLVVV